MAFFEAGAAALPLLPNERRGRAAAGLGQPIRCSGAVRLREALMQLRGCARRYGDVRVSHPRDCRSAMRSTRDASGPSQISDEIRHEGGCSPGNATRCCGPCSSALGPPHRADRGDRAQVLDQLPVDGESALA